MLLTLASCSDKNNPPDGSWANPPAAETESIAIICENDVHCAVEGYSKLAAMKAERDGNHEFDYQLARLVELKKSMDDIKDGHNMLKIKKQI